MQLEKKRLDLERSLNSELSTKNQKPKILELSKKNLSGKEDPSRVDPLPRIIFIDKTEPARVNVLLPMTLSRSMHQNASPWDRSIPMKILPPTHGIHLPTSATFNLGGGHQSISESPITKLIRHKVMMEAALSTERVCEL